MSGSVIHSQSAAMVPAVYSAGQPATTYVPPFLCDAHAVCRYTAEGPAEPDGA